MAEWSAPGIRNRRDGDPSSTLSAVSVSPSCSLLPVYPVIFSACVFSALSYFSKLPVDWLKKLSSLLIEIKIYFYKLITSHLPFFHQVFPATLT